MVIALPVSIYCRKCTIASPRRRGEMDTAFASGAKDSEFESRRRLFSFAHVLSIFGVDASPHLHTRSQAPAAQPGALFSVDCFVSAAPGVAWCVCLSSLPSHQIEHLATSLDFQISFQLALTQIKQIVIYWIRI